MYIHVDLCTVFLGAKNLGLSTVWYVHSSGGDLLIYIPNYIRTKQKCFKLKKQNTEYQRDQLSYKKEQEN